MRMYLKIVLKYQHWHYFPLHPYISGSDIGVSNIDDADMVISKLT